MRNISQNILDQYAAGSVSPVLFAEMFFDSGTLRLWTGYGTIEFDGDTYTGGGNLIGISPIDETQELQAKGIVCTLTGMPTSLIALALTNKTRGRRFNLYLGYAASTYRIGLEDESGAILLEDESGYVVTESEILETPYRIFSGLMDTIEITDNGETADMRLSVENILIVGQRQKVARYTDEDQRKRFPNDKGLSLINQLQDKELVW